MENTNKTEKIHKILIGFFVAMVIIAAPIVFFAATFQSHISLEAGTEFKQEMLWKTPVVPKAIINEDVNTDVVGTKSYEAILFGYVPVRFEVEVCDTTPPQVMVSNLVIPYGGSCKPEDLVKECKDVSAVSYQFLKAPDCNKTGTQVVTLQITDEKNNVTTIAARVTVVGFISDYVMDLGGELPSAMDFVLDPAITAEYVSEPIVDTFTKLGRYEVPILFDGKETMVTISVVDKTAPEVTVANKESYLNKEITADAFVTSIKDASETTVSYKSQPDFTKEGTQKITIVVKDVAGNLTEKEVELTVLKDTTAPSINTTHIKVTVNGSLSYKKSISVSDNCDSSSEIKLEIDNSGVDLSNIGSYKILVKATDTAGNTTEKEITVQVVDTATEVHTLEEINSYCDDLLAKIINDSMTMREKAAAIYQWTYHNIGYADNSPKDDWLTGAYNGLVKRTGDCYTYAATAKALLERIGLEPMVIRKEVTANTSSNNHWWLLLDLGDGYYHFDPTRRKDRTEFFMWTDAQLKVYSDAHRGSHNFNRDLYPEIQ